MFSPPPTTVYYHVIDLNLQNETHLELISAHGLFDWKVQIFLFAFLYSGKGGPLTWEPPEPLYPNYGNHRNWKFWENFNWNSASNEIRLEFGRWSIA